MACDNEKAPFNVFANNLAEGVNHWTEETDGHFGIEK